MVLALLFTSDFVTRHWDIALSVGAGLLGASVFSLVIAMWPNSIQQPPSPLSLIRLTHLSAEDMHQLIATATASAILDNQRLLRRKRTSLAAATIVVITGVGVIAGRLIYALT